MNPDTIIAVCRVWKKAPKTPILIFPEDVNPAKYYVGMWEQIGQHGEGDPQHVVQQTRLATQNEANEMAGIYEHIYNCKINLRKKLKINWRP
jgi:hypothetical protein